LYRTLLATSKTAEGRIGFVTVPPAVTNPALFGGNARLAIKMRSINFIKVTKVV
jgi:hypothetical protein